MPHSSGGGSHGGGFHSSHSSSYSGGGGYVKPKDPATRNHAHKGYTKYVYYYSKHPTYRYVKDTPERFPWFEIIVASLFLAIGLVMVLLSYKKIEPIDAASYDSEIIIEDNIDVLTDAEENNLEEAFEKFRDKTGIACSLVTDTNESWNANYSSLENYAYDLYVNRFNDEKHWLFVYTQPLSSDDDFVDWNWEGMQGNDTDEILTYHVTESFTESLQKYLTRNDCSVGEAFRMAISKTTSGIKVSGYACDVEQQAMGYVFAVFSLTMLVVFIVGDAIPARKEQKEINTLHKTGTPIPENTKEDTCEYCGGVYIHGVHTSCPHCAAPIKAKVD